MPIVKIQYGKSHIETEVPKDATLLDAVRAAGLPFSAPCGGKGTCGKCEVTLHDKKGTQKVLACNTPAEDGVLIEVNDATAVINVELLRAATPSNNHGVAIDLGTTTLAAELVDLQTGNTIARAGRMNPQSIYGADVISRIEASDSGHLDSMRTLIVDGLYGLIERLCQDAKLPLSNLTSITLAGNTIMEHILTGLSPVSIGVAPYEPQSYFGEHQQLWQDLPPVWLAPCISGYVGGDVVAGMLLEQCLPNLLIDLGTNGELALQAEHVSVSAATAAGPVFEGMNVRFGMPALPGALSVATYDEGTNIVSAEVIGGGTIKGICGSGLIDLIAIMLAHGLIDESGRVLGPDESSSPLSNRIVEFEGGLAFKPLDDSHIVITQRDVRNLQLAKSAIAAGIEILLDTAQLTYDDFAQLAIAGNFGQYIDKEHAARLGLIPASLLDRANSVGNSSLYGARKALLDPAVQQQMTNMARNTQYVELSTDSRFTASFVDNMSFE